MAYKDQLLGHLAQFRRDELNVAEPGTFSYKGRVISVEHILPESEAWLGVPSEVRESVRTYVTARQIRLHRYFHHLNSSQAFSLSLFVPFFEGGAAASGALLRAIGIAGDLAEWEAERVPDQTEATNLDAWWRTTAGDEYFCEVKLTESEFGVAANDERHRMKLATLYEPRLRAHLQPRRLEATSFFSAYQVCRNLWHAAEAPKARVVFLYPKQQTVLTTLLTPVLNDITSELRGRVVIAHSEEVIARIRSDDSCPASLRVYAGKLARKYLFESS